MTATRERSGHGWMILVLVAGAGIGALIGLLFDHRLIGIVIGLVIAGFVGFVAMSEDARVRSRHVQEGVTSQSPRGDGSVRDNRTAGPPAAIAEQQAERDRAARTNGSRADRVEPSHPEQTDDGRPDAAGTSMRG